MVQRRWWALTGTDRAFVLGIDGVPWSLLSSWVEAGELPAFATLLEEGAAGPLESTTPPNSPVAWPSIATGVWPDRHGVYEFTALDRDHGQRPSRRTDLRQPPLWEILSPAVVANVPVTYPAGGVGPDGAMVAGMLTPGVTEEGFTHPPALAETVEAEIPDYRVGLAWHEYDPAERARFRADLDDLLASRRALLEHLLATDDWRLFFFTFTAPDRLQHLVWDRDEILAHYRDLDEILADVLAYCRRHGATLYVVSDHGFGPVSRVVYVNRVLADAGLLAPANGGGLRGTLSRAGITKDTVMDLLARAGVDDRTLVERLPAGLVDAAARQVPGDHALYDADPSATLAFLDGMGSVYVNDAGRFTDGAVPPAERGRVKDLVIALLEAVRDPATGDAPLRVHDGHALYPDDDFAPDVVLEGVDGYHVKPGLADAPFADADDIAAHHRNEGVFFAWGPDVASSQSIADATVVDVAPTLLHGLGEPVPERAHGEVLASVFAAGSPPAERPVRERRYRGTETTATDEDDDGSETVDEDVADRLRGLGYM